MNKTILPVRLVFTEPLLGTASGNRDIHKEYIASKAPNPEKTEEELASLPPVPIGEQVEKASTLFPKDLKGLHLWDYQIRGFFKEALFVLIETGQINLSTWVHKRAVDNFLFVSPRKIYITDENGTILDKADDDLERPLRATTMQGDRVALARSEQVNAGRIITFDIMWLGGFEKKVKNKKSGEEEDKKSKIAVFNEEIVRSLLDYGMFKGLGQWRNGSYGRFSWTTTKDTEEEGKGEATQGDAAATQATA